MKRVTVVVVALALAVVANADDKKADAKTVAEQYVAAALAGKFEEAAGLGVEGKSPGRKEKVEEFKSLVDAKTVKLPAVWSDDKKGQAIAVSEEVKLTKAQPDGTDKGCLVFALIKTGDKWQVKDIDFGSEAQAKDQVSRFKQKNPDAKEMSSKGGK